MDDSKTRPTEIYRSEDGKDNIIDKFLEKLSAYEVEVTNWLANPQPMLPLTADEQTKYDASTDCSLCNFPLDIAPTQHERFRWLPDKARDNVDNWKKVRDHCHFTGKFRGAAHSWCNLQTKSKFKIPVILHNFRGYDSHLIMRSGNFESYKRISCIANNLEKYMCINLDSHIRFIDSLQFLDEKLETLIEMRYELVQQHYRENPNDDNDSAIIAKVFPLLSAEFPDINQRQMLLRKGVYPYEWVQNWKCFKQQHLPSQDDFKSSLRGNESIPNADYHARATCVDRIPNEEFWRLPRPIFAQ